MPGIFSKNRIVAGENFNRWKVPVASVAIHLCIGSVYAWSIFNPALIKVHGVAASAAGDWTEKQALLTYTLAIVFLGLSAAFAGRWLERVGPRVVGTVAAVCWGGGFLLGGLGIWLHQTGALPPGQALWLLYLGYGVLGGCGLGLGYVSPVSTLIRWFPDRRGMAAGMAIMGFGGGAMIGAPLKEWLIQKFHRAPEYLGKATDIVLKTNADGVRLDEQGREVVVVAADEVQRMIVPGDAGVYLVGSGNAGIMEAFLVLGVLYFVVMIVAAFSYRIPKPGWQPEDWTPPSEEQSEKKMISTANVGLNQAMKTPQFYLVWIVLCFNVTAGIGVLGVAKTMMTDIFQTTLPHIVDGAFAATFVILISVFNMVGRFFWASASDWLGRKTTYTIFFVLGIALYLSIPFSAQMVSASQAVVWLVTFYAATMIIFTMYGGGFATVPAYLADLFGTKYVGGIHGRLLTAWSTAGVLGPMAIAVLKDRTRLGAIEDLAAKVDAEKFAATFGQPITELKTLVEAKTVTIAKLMEIVPAGTTDPTPTLYNTTMYLMAGLLALALIANLSIKPVASKHHLSDET